MRRIVAAIAALFLSMFALTACSDYSKSATGGETATFDISVAAVPVMENSNAESQIIINGFEFMTPDSVSPGEVVAIRNNGSAQHSVTSDMTGKFNRTVPAGEVGSFTAPTQAGNYTFHCMYHPSMHGTLKVK
ncbi:cupredoxin domain-containing protein [Rhodococcus sp. NPDC056743]|uniref:cupredoxin domain-containing protein n=1 Tax=Rhodococcus sp. NPDC056743 TaxID=3345934 RepID=UPI00366AC93F